jgi:benzylsuccinate CoA-transferase BbsF subunit
MSPFRDGVPGVNRSGYFAERNSSKRSICLDLREREGRELALRLIARSDVVIDNFTPGTMDRLGLGYEAARAVRPDIIYLEMPMQGRTGPHRDFRGYGVSIAAASGLYGLSGYPDRPPVGTGTNFPDHVPNPLHATIAILAALQQRKRTGKGRYIELAQLESTATLIGAALVAAAAGHPVERAGNDDPVAAPHGVYPCAGEDRWCAIAVTTDAQWIALADVLDLPAGRFATAADRRAARRELDELIAARTPGFRAEDLAHGLTAAGVPAAPVQNARDLIEHDPQLAARGHFVRLDHPEMGPSLYSGIPYRLSRTRGHLRSPAPLLGADSHDVCTGLLDVDEDEYALLKEKGIVG